MDLQSDAIPYPQDGCCCNREGTLSGSNKMTLFDGGDLEHVLFARSCRLSRNNGKEVILQVERAYAIYNFMDNNQHLELHPAAY